MSYRQRNLPAKSIAEAKRKGKKTFMGMDKSGMRTKKLAAVSREDMKKAGFKSFGKDSLNRYLMGKGPRTGKDLGGDFTSIGLKDPDDRPRKKKVTKKKKSRGIFGIGGAKKGGKVSDGVKFVARQYGGKIGN